ncbi:MAG: GntR family transcriptional regulator/MocR family aminotransferase [Granulosicoccus sp.]|jgi:GntR family transcriptional regulator/MocR family aminotransferase
MRKALKTYHQRRDFFCDLLQKELGDFVEFKKPDGGLAVWTKFDEKIDMTKLSEAAAAKNLYIADSKRYDPIGKELNFTRLGFASMNEQEMKVGVKILKGEIEKSFLSSLL